MGVVNPAADPANVVQALVFTLLDVFDATRDLYQTLKKKERRDYEENLRSRGYPGSRRLEYVDDDEGGEEDIVVDKAAVKRQFEIGMQEVGAQYAVGDVISQTTLQSEIITLQSVIITTFLYGPTSPEPISHQLSKVVAASRAAGTTAVDTLAAQRERQISVLPFSHRSAPSPVARTSVAQPPPYPVTATSSASTALVKSRGGGTSYPAKTTIMDVTSRPKMNRSDTESTSFSGPTAYGTQSIPHTQFCLYSLDLQRHPTQTLASSLTSDPSPYCPYCKRVLNLSPGKSWEIFKDDDGAERCFRIQNRFVIKCHRESVDGGYSCVLCSNSAAVDTVCGDVKALIRHVWMDHGGPELELEDDIVEVVDKGPERRRDSGMAFSDAKGARRSVSLGPGGRPRGRRREVETLEIRYPRREG